LTFGCYTVYIDFMANTMTKTTAGIADINALRNRILKERSRIDDLLREVEKALGKGPTAKSAKPESAAPPVPSPLDEAHELVKATEDLRVANGNLSAQAIAGAFGVSMNQLAGWLRRSRQALAKTPDADSLQNELAFFERVARLRAVLPKAAFQKWLRMPNAQLDHARPLDLLAGKERQVIVDLTEDMLTGAPT